MAAFEEPTYAIGPLSYLRMREALRKELGREAAEAKGSVFNTGVTANTNIFDSDLSPTYTPCIFRIYCCFNASGVLTVRRTKAEVTVSQQLNAGATLVANAGYLFDIIVDSGETINLQYSVNATCLKLSVVELSAGA